MTNEITGASLGSNQITLPAGTYYIEASAPAFRVNQHKIKVYDTTNTVDLLIGSSEYDTTTAQTQSRSFVSGRFTLSAQAVVELQHQVTTTRAANGHGVPSSFSVVEVYADVRIWQHP